jgi:hypothetical protein
VISNSNKLICNKLNINKLKISINLTLINLILIIILTNLISTQYLIIQKLSTLFSRIQTHTTNPHQYKQNQLILNIILYSCNCNKMFLKKKTPTITKTT